MGVSVEEEKVSFRIKDLIATPAKVKFLSVEPLIGEVKNLYLKNIDWVIVGGESGPGARPVKKEWVERVLRECKKYDVPFFFKQSNIGRDTFFYECQLDIRSTKHFTCIIPNMY